MRTRGIITEFNGQRFVTCRHGDPTHYVCTTTQDHQLNGATIMTVGGHNLGDVTNSLDVIDQAKKARNHRTGLILPVRAL